MEGKEIKTAIGTISLDHIEFGEILIDMFFDIRSIPSDIQEKINTALESAKEKQLQRMKGRYADKESAWNAEGTDTEISLHICIDNKGFSSRIEADETDKKNEMMWAWASVEVDLSKHMAGLKPFIVKAITEKLNTIKYETC